MPDEQPQIADNVERNRYEIVIGDHVAYLDYRRRERFIVLVHTEVPEALRERGLGGKLARHALDAARTAGVEVVVKCPFVTTWLKRHREYDDIVVARIAEDARNSGQPPTEPR